MIRVTVMEPSEAWLLFVLTVIIYGTTVFILHWIADRFRDYAVPPDSLILRGSNSNLKAVTKPEQGTSPPNGGVISQGIHVPSGKSVASTGFMSATYGLFGIDSTSRGIYTELHDTLDVSVFK